jgi:lipopolysaccharide export system protein LptA
MKPITHLGQMLPALLVAAGALGLTAVLASAQGAGPTRNTRQPVVIEADKGVEWRQKELVYVARGNATAARGKTKIRADVLTAHYRKPKKAKKPKNGTAKKPAKKPTGGPSTQIWKITAKGGVRIDSNKDVITGDHAVYLVKEGVFTLTGGRGVKIVSKDRTITGARIEYHAKALKAYVLGNARIVEKDRKVFAKRFIAYMKRGKKGGNTLKRVEAIGNVVIITKTEIARGDKGDYNAEKRLATLTGNVKLTRGDNQLNGARAVVNFKTGVSRLLGRTGTRVQVILVPREGEGTQGLPGLGPSKKPGAKDKKKARRKRKKGAR